MYRLISDEDYNKICEVYPQIKTMNLEMVLDSINESDIQQYLNELKDEGFVDVSQFTDDKLISIDKKFMKYIAENTQLITDDVYGYITDIIHDMYVCEMYRHNLEIKNDILLNLIKEGMQTEDITYNDIFTIYSSDDIAIVKCKSNIFLVNTKNNVCTLLSNYYQSVNFGTYDNNIVVNLITGERNMMYIIDKNTSKFQFCKLK